MGGGDGVGGGGGGRRVGGAWDGDVEAGAVVVDCVLLGLVCLFLRVGGGACLGLKGRSACSVAAHSPMASQPLALCHEGQIGLGAALLVLRFGRDGVSYRELRRPPSMTVFLLSFKLRVLVNSRG